MTHARGRGPAGPVGGRQGSPVRTGPEDVPPGGVTRAPARSPREAAARPGLLRRLAALAYDALLLFAVLFAATVPVLLFTGGRAVDPNDPVFTAYLLAVSYAWFGWCWTRSGQTLGMRAWRMRVCTREGTRLGWWRSLGRFAAALVSIGTAGAGLLWVAVDRDRRSLHDRLSGTVVEMVPPEA